MPVTVEVDPVKSTTIPTFPTRMFRRALTALLLAATALHGAPDPSRFEHISLDEGLSQTTVHCLLQDRFGFLWIGTGNGLNRYDGYEMRVYYHRPEDSLSLSDSQVRRLLEDPAGRLWVGTEHGLNRLVLIPGEDATAPRREAFLRYHAHPDSAGALGNDDIWSLAAAPDGDLWVGTAAGLYRLREPDGRSLRFEAVGDSVSGPRGRVPTVLVQDDRTVWAGGLGDGLFRIDPRDGAVFRPSLEGSPRFVVTLMADHLGRLWVGTYGQGLLRLDSGAAQLQRVGEAELSSDRVFALARSDSTTLWVGTFGGGLNRLDLATGAVRVYQKVEVSSGRLSDDYVRSLLIDRSNNLWTGTNDGVNRLGLRPPKFRHLRSDPDDPNSLAHPNVLSMHQGRDGTVWVGSNAGLDRIAPDGAVRHYRIPHNNPRSGEGFVYAIHQDRAGDMWVGTFGGGLYRYDRDRDRFTQLTREPGDPASLGNVRVYDILEDRRGRLWVATVSGVDRLERDSETFVHHRHDPEDPASLSSDVVYVLHEDPLGRLWVGTRDGLNRRDEATESWIRYGAAEGLGNTAIQALWGDTTGAMWVGTAYGLYRLGASGTVTRRLSDADGLPSGSISGLQGDGRGRLWISTLRGLACLDGDDLRVFEVGDGLQSLEFNAGSSYRNPDTGELFFGGVNGLNRFFPERVRDNPVPPPVVLTGFATLGQPRYAGLDLAHRRRIELRPEERFFAVEFAALDFTQPHRNRYAYRLEGFDAAWVEVGSRRYASYTNLDPGDYRFRVRAANPDGVWNETGVAIDLRLHPPYWATWWFRLLVVVSVAGVLAFLHRYRVSRALEIERMRVRIASDLHDDVGSTLTKISLYSDVIRSGKEPAEVLPLVERIGQMSRELIGTMSDIVWSIDARNDTVADLLDRMRDFAVSVLSARNIDHEVTVSGLDMGSHLPIDLRQNLYLIFKEAINNAARHSGADRVTVDLTAQGGELELVVADDGTGLGESRRRSGQGLRNMAMRARRIGGDLSIDGKEGVTVRLRTRL